MFKKLISVLTAFALLIAFSPAVAADATPATPTVESILNEYQDEVFADLHSKNNMSVDAKTPRSSDTRLSLEQETINKLTAAGYEAYNVTSENYDTLQRTLKTDLSKLGIFNNNSYIVVISGEEGTRYQPEFPYFTYNYEGISYTMRYVTVQADSTGLNLYTEVDLLEETGQSVIDNVLDYAFSVICYIVELIEGPVPIGSYILSALSSIVDYGESSINATSNDVYKYAGGTNWTVVYTQIFDYDNGEWITCSSIEYVKMRYWFNHRFYNPAINGYDGEETSGTYGNIYSEYYYDSTWRKEFAVLSYVNPIMNYCQKDTIDYVVYEIEDEEVFTHWRGVEEFQLIPELN